MTSSPSAVAASALGATNVVSPAKRQRADHPVLDFTQKGSREGNFAALSSEKEWLSALETIGNLVYAVNSQKSRYSNWKAWCDAMLPWGVPPLPMTQEKVRLAAASFRAGRFRSPRPYFTRADQEPRNVLKQDIDTNTPQAIKDFSSAVERGIGPSVPKEAFDRVLLTELIPTRCPTRSLAPSRSIWLQPS